MLRMADGVGGLRRWTEERGGWPCRRLDGRLAVGFAGDICRGVEIGWAEFLATFCAQRSAFVLDDDPASRTCFVGSPDEAQGFVDDLTSRALWGAAAVPGPALAAGAGATARPPSAR